MNLDHHFCIARTNGKCDFHYCMAFKKCVHDRKTFKIKTKKKYKNKPSKVRTLVKLGHKKHCKCCLTDYNLTFDHIIPKSKGGSNLLTNGQILCSKCNGLKGNRIISIEELRKELY